MQTHAPHVRHVRETLLSDNWYTLKKYTFELLRRDGRWQEQSREAYDRGNGAVILLYNREKRTVVLTRQFRFPVCRLCRILFLELFRVDITCKLTHRTSATFARRCSLTIGTP